MSGEAAAAFLITHWGKMVISAIGAVAFWKYKKDDEKQELRFKRSEDAIKTLEDHKHQTKEQLSLIKAENATMKDVLQAFMASQAESGRRSEEHVSQIHDSINNINLNLVEVRTKLSTDIENIKKDIEEIKSNNNKEK